MRTLWFFVLFTCTAESAKNYSNEKLKSPLTLKPNEILEILERSGDFRKTLDHQLLLFSGPRSIRLDGLDLGKSVAMVIGEFRFMHETILRAYFAYVRQRLDEYCSGLTELMTTIGERKNHPERNVRESIRFADDVLYCPLTAFYEYHESLVSRVLAFQRIGSDDTCSDWDVTITRLLNVCQSFATDRTPDETDYVDSVSGLKRVKERISNVSNLFCTRWTVFFGHRRTLAETVQSSEDESPFVDFVLRDVKCISVLRESDPDVDQEHQIIIPSMYCDSSMIREYRYEKFEKYSMVKWNACVPSYSDPESEPFEKYESILSLATLREMLKSNAVLYPIVENYNNVVSEVVLLVSVSEGCKIFNGILFVVTEYCERVNESKGFAGKMRELRSALFAYKSALDRLARMIERENYINITSEVEIQKGQFDVLANLVMESLNIRDDDDSNQLPRICSRIPELLLSYYDTDNNYYSSFTNFHPFTLKLENFYLTEPLLNISRLYRFVANRL